MIVRATQAVSLGIGGIGGGITHNIDLLTDRTGPPVVSCLEDKPNLESFCLPAHSTILEFANGIRGCRMKHCRSRDVLMSVSLVAPARYLRVSARLLASRS